MKRRVLLLSTVHPATDPRILYKIAPSLAKEYQVFCALPNAKPDTADGTFTVISLPDFQSLFLRLLFSHIVVLYKCLRIRPDLVHIFVPELIPIAFVFKLLGGKVIYEVQENLFKKFSIKTHNNAWLYRRLFRFFDHCARKHFALIFTEDAYVREYDKLAHPAAIVRNYALPSFIDTYLANGPSTSVNPEIIYMGVISLERSFDTIVVALATLKKRYPDFKMHLFGSLRIAQHEIEKLPGYDEIAENLTFYGYTDQKKIFEYARNAVAGIALLKPVADYPESYTTKLFEYMSLQVPVITSDFPLYRNVVEQSGCGFCISPYRADLLSEKLQWLIENPEERIRMGRNGRNSVEKMYNWTSEEDTLLSFYRALLRN
ncbi:glycosyltransferase [Dyadobacter psychrophilus]|uniref:Glycosyltransferase involved in cell wall bisynthesis n=1 Tax=Dyadobacter psychrophilus TaxID=651661 RepID=A0A1T5H963_9BACT|nr:glycosyltransferase [Dyadobacter psychrophilus]SKC17174.1 Glycosyltransferase involved in cell wall bisynthesis [Dyadobacter psychrophilus]